jgi:hypothetical protein
VPHNWDQHYADPAHTESAAVAIAQLRAQAICGFFYLQRSLFPQIREGVHPAGLFAGWKVLFYSEGGEPYRA